MSPSTFFCLTCGEKLWNCDLLIANFIWPTFFVSGSGSTNIGLTASWICWQPKLHGSVDMFMCRGWPDCLKVGGFSRHWDQSAVASLLRLNSTVSFMHYVLHPVNLLLFFPTQMRGELISCSFLHFNHEYVNCTYFFGKTCSVGAGALWWSPVSGQVSWNWCCT